MSIQLGQIAPDFEQDSTQGRIRFHEWLGDSWGLFFSHPKNFTPVCTTELGEVARLRPEWDKRNVKPIGLSIDPVEAHHKWEDDIEETQGQKLDFPMIADPDGTVSKLYGMIHPECDATVTVRSRSEEHTSELQSLMRISYAVFCLTKKKTTKTSTC